MITCIQCKNPSNITFKGKDYCWEHFDEASKEQEIKNDMSNTEANPKNPWGGGSGYDGTYLVSLFSLNPIKKVWNK